MTSAIKEAMRSGEATHIGAARSLVQAQVTESRRERIARRLERRHAPSTSQDLAPSVADEARLAATRRELSVSIEAGLSGQSTFTDRARVARLLGEFEAVIEATIGGSTIGTFALEE